MWLQTYGWMDGQTDGQNNGQTDRIMGGQTYEWIDMQYMRIDMQKTMIFQKILRFLQKHYGPTNGPTDGPTDRRTHGPTDRRTDIPSYRDAVAASKKDNYSLPLSYMSD